MAHSKKRPVVFKTAVVNHKPVPKNLTRSIYWFGLKKKKENYLISVTIERGGLTNATTLASGRTSTSVGQRSPASMDRLGRCGSTGRSGGGGAGLQQCRGGSGRGGSAPVLQRTPAARCRLCSARRREKPCQIGVPRVGRPISARKIGRGDSSAMESSGKDGPVGEMQMDGAATVSGERRSVTAEWNEGPQGLL